jgi:hypothetical protein
MHATPPAQQCSAYFWFGKLKKCPSLPLAMPCHLHAKGQHIFGLENLKRLFSPLAMLHHLYNNAQHKFGFANLKDGRHYLLQCHAT